MQSNVGETKSMENRKETPPLGNSKFGARTQHRSIGEGRLRSTATLFSHCDVMQISHAALLKSSKARSALNPLDLTLILSAYSPQLSPKHDTQNHYTPRNYLDESFIRNRCRRSTLGGVCSRCFSQLSQVIAGSSQGGASSRRRHAQLCRR